jgi:hypothetical protein
VTGKLENYTRDGINTKIASIGAIAGSSVTKKTDYLICGKKPGKMTQRHPLKYFRGCLLLRAFLQMMTEECMNDRRTKAMRYDAGKYR